ncbi:MAG TPA: ABC transporter substrate-binding protein [bacterium]|nr:ABC transporter substrate-binding protein [bacterium]
MRTPSANQRGAIATLAVAAMLAISVVVVPGSVTGWAAEPVTFIWGKTGDAETLDQPLSADAETAQVNAQMFNTLVRMTPGQTDIEPDLATSWSVSPDGLMWTFKLRRGVAFQDGTPWNGAAAVFNINRWADATNPYHVVTGHDYFYWNSFMAGAFREARAPDPYTLEIVLTKPDAPLVYNLSILGFDFTSPAAIMKYGAQGLGQHPVGTGAFKFVEWVRDDHVTMVANPSYFRKGLPKSQRLIMRVIKDNAARFLALKAGEIQAMELPNPDDVKTAAADPTLAVTYRPPFNVGWLRFNMNDPLFKDKRMREAVALAINRKAIVDALYGGYGTVADQHLPPGVWGRADVTGYPYDPAMAKQLLAEAGYPNGFSFDLWYIPVSRAYFPNGKDIGTAIASDLGKVGIRAHLQTEDWVAYLKDIRSNKFQVDMVGWNGPTADPDDWLGFLFSGYDPTNGYLSYNNPTVFDLIAKARVATNQAARARMYAQAETIILNDYRDVPIAHAKVPILLRKNVEGLAGQANGVEYMETVWLR